MPRSHGSSPRPAKEGDEAAATRLRGVLGDLLEACRLVGLAVAPFMPNVGADQVLAQTRLRIRLRRGRERRATDPRTQLAWGARAGEPGRVAAPEPLFPRLDVETEAG